MLQRLKSHAGLLALLLLSLVILAKARLIGDGNEYLLMSHALLEHGTVDIRAADVDYFLHLPPEQQARIPVPQETYSQLRKEMDSPKPGIVAGFFPNDQGKIYAIHFWLYSLLALPLYALTRLLHLNPTIALALLNLVFAAAAMAYLGRVIPQRKNIATLLFLTLGTLFYLTWTGPEVMSASCALIASIALLRANPGLALLAAGLGASQNPSLILLMPLACVYRLMLARWPGLAWPGCRPRALDRRQLAMGVAGVVLALLPYAFFQLQFHTPSVIAKFTTDPKLISASRLYSLLFDLNQGMLVGVPGLLLVLPLLAWLLAPAHRRRWGVAALGLMATVLVMALPTLSTQNWNPGGIVMLRYNYWLAMPLLALLLLGLAELTPSRARLVTGLVLACQLLVVLGSGLLGEKSSHVRHTPLARWVLQHYPAAYNPEVEIFYERSVGAERYYTHDMTYLYQADGKPLKLLRHWSNLGESAGLCPQGSLVQSDQVVGMADGWEYLHAPFRCAVNEQDSKYRLWHISGAGAQGQQLLGKGWSTPEATGVWTNGPQSTLVLPVTPGQPLHRLRFLGNYFAGQNASEVSINGVALGPIDLQHSLVDIPASLANAATLTVTLGHPHAISPKARGLSEDARDLGFYMEAVLTDARP